MAFLLSVTLLILQLCVLECQDFSEVVLVGNGQTCPNETVVLTCQVTEAPLLDWIAEPFIKNSDPIRFIPYDRAMRTETRGQFTSTITDILHLSDRRFANITSTLSFEANDQIDGTVIECFDGTTRRNFTFSIAAGICMNKTTTCSSNGTWTPEVECPEQDTEPTAARTSCTTTLAGAVASSVVATAVVSLLLGALLMWCIMTKLAQRKHVSEAASSTERNSPLETMEPYYEDVRVREEQFRTDVNAAYGKSGQKN